MKSKLSLTIATILATTTAFAQDDRRPEPPRPPDAANRPVPPRPPIPGLGREGGPRNAAPGPDQRPLRPTPFLGVATARVPASLSAQLNLPEGFGLVVEDVLPDSPAAAAGIQRHDVLRMLDDQQLVDPDQLAALVRSRGKDAQVSLTLLRKGQEQKVTARVGERPLPEHRLLPRPFQSLRELNRGDERVEDPARRLYEDTRRRIEERTRDIQNRLREARPGATAEAQVLPPPPAFDPIGAVDLLREVRPGGAAEVKLIQDGNTTTWNTAQARVVLKDDSGQIDVSSENGKRMLTAKNAQGETIFSGPIDTEEQRRTLPEKVRAKLQKIDIRTSVELPGVAPAQGTELDIQ